MKKTILRTYKLKHSINIGKQKKILEILKEYRELSYNISNRQWKYFYKNGEFNKNLEIDSIETKFSKRYRQTAQYQVVGQLKSYISNRKNDFKKISLPITTNSYFEGIKGDISNFIQINFQKDINKINGNISLSKNKSLDYNDYKIDKLALDLGLNNLFATNLGELYGRNFSKLLKKYNEIITILAKNRQKQKLRTLSKRYKKLVNKIKSYLKNEIDRTINNIVKNNKPKEIIVERLNFTSPKLSKKLNRMLSNFGKKAIEEKFKSLKEKYNIDIREVNPAYTSQTCSKCGYIDKKNRKSQEVFICGFCGKKQNADINASKKQSGFLGEVKLGIWKNHK